MKKENVMKMIAITVVSWVLIACFLSTVDGLLFNNDGYNSLATGMRFNPPPPALLDLHKNAIDNCIQSGMKNVDECKSYQTNIVANPFFSHPIFSFLGLHLAKVYKAESFLNDSLQHLRWAGLIMMTLLIVFLGLVLWEFPLTSIVSFGVLSGLSLIFGLTDARNSGVKIDLASHFSSSAILYVVFLVWLVFVSRDSSRKHLFHISIVFFALLLASNLNGFGRFPYLFYTPRQPLMIVLGAMLWLACVMPQSKKLFMLPLLGFFHPVTLSFVVFIAFFVELLAGFRHAEVWKGRPAKIFLGVLILGFSFWLIVWGGSSLNQVKKDKSFTVFLSLFATWSGLLYLGILMASLLSLWVAVKAVALEKSPLLFRILCFSAILCAIQATAGFFSPFLAVGRNDIPLLWVLAYLDHYIGGAIVVALIGLLASAHGEFVVPKFKIKNSLFLGLVFLALIFVRMPHSISFFNLFSRITDFTYKAKEGVPKMFGRVAIPPAYIKVSQSSIPSCLSVQNPMSSDVFYFSLLRFKIELFRGDYKSDRANSISCD